MKTIAEKQRLEIWLMFLKCLHRSCHHLLRFGKAQQHISVVFVLFIDPDVHCAAHIVGNFPNLVLQSCTLLDIRHAGNLVVVWGESGAFGLAFLTPRHGAKHIKGEAQAMGLSAQVILGRCACRHKSRAATSR